MYKKLAHKLNHAQKAVRESSKFDDLLYDDKVAELRRLDKEVKLLPSYTLVNPNGAVFAYVRYADDWVLGLKSSKATAKDIYDKCETFFKETLLLKWNKDKSILSRSIDQDFEFLGVDLHFTTPKQIRVIKQKSSSGRLYKRRSVSVNMLNFRVNVDNIFARLKKRGYVNENNEPISYTKILNQDIITIVKIYLSTMRGIVNYYRFVHNIQAVNYIHFVLFMSLCKTLAHKGKTTKRQIIKKYIDGAFLSFKYGVNRDKELTVAKSIGLKRDTSAFQIGKVTDDRDPIPKGHISDTATWIKLGICGLCGKKGYTEMHHLRHILRQGHKYKGFDLVMQNINRKQVPLCLSCHHKVHKGLYDGININHAAEQFYKNLGFSKWKNREKNISNSTNK